VNPSPHSSHSTPQRALRHTELAQLIASQVCVHASMAGMRMASPLWALRQGYSALAVGFLLALFALASVFLALPSGRYADRHGLKRPAALSVAVALAGAALPMLFPIFPVMCLGALLTGAATGTMSIALQRHVGRAAVDVNDLKRVFSWLAIGPAISNFLGPLAAGLMIDHTGVLLGGQAGDTNGFRSAFLLMALLPLASWLWVRHTAELPRLVAVDDGDSEPKHALDLLRNPSMQRLMLVNWMLSSCWDVHTFVVPVIGHEHGYSASVIGSILGSFALAATLVRMVMPLLVARLREGAVVCTAMVITAVLFALYPLMPSALAMGACSVMLGLALGAVQPMIMSTLHQITPEARHGEALGLRMMAINASSVLMPMLFGTAGAVVGVSAVFWFVGSVAGLGARSAWKIGLDPRG
jgi:MFS family permease